MKVLFIFYETTYLLDPEEPLGPLILNAVLKQHGHKVKGAKFNDTNYQEIYQEIEDFKPQLIALSTTFGIHYKYLDILRQIKEKYPGIIIIFGGGAPTFNPELIKLPYIDIICRGEGEYPFIELLQKLEKKESYHNIKNLWVKDGDRIYENPLRPFLTEEELEKLPFPDRSIFDSFPYLRNFGMKSVMAGRGCPLNCSYCFNHQMKKMAEGKYVRFRSPERVMEEIESLVASEKNVHFFAFQDDFFVHNKDWLRRFTSLYKNKVNIPYKCNIFLTDQIDEETCEYLKMSNCVEVTVGIENGNENLRKEVMNRLNTNKLIVEKTRLFNKFGFRVVSQNIIGIPDETNDTVCDTMDLNKKCRVFLANIWYFVPFKGTRVFEYIQKKGYELQFPEYPVGFHDRIALKFPYEHNFEELKGLLYLGVDYPFFNHLIRFAYTGRYHVIKKILRKVLWKIYDFLYSSNWIDKVKHSARPDKVRKKLKVYSSQETGSR